MHLTEETTITSPPRPTKIINGIPQRRDDQHIQGLVADLCLTLTANSRGNRLRSDRFPLKQLKRRAYSALLKQSASSVPSENKSVASCLERLPVEEVLLAKAFEWHLSGRRQRADQLRRCLSQLHLEADGVRPFLQFLLLLSEDTAERADGSARPFARRQTSPDRYRQAASRGEVPWFTEYPSELFEGTQGGIPSYDGVPAFRGLFEAVPGFDSNGNPLFTLSNTTEARSDKFPLRDSHVFCLPEVPSLNKLSRIQMAHRFGMSRSKEERQQEASSSASSGKLQRLPQITGDGFREEGPPAEAPRSRELPALPFRASEFRIARDKCKFLLHPSTVTTRILLQHILYLLAGIPSESFRWDRASKRFVARGGLRTEDVSEQALQSMLAGFLQCGTEVHCLEEWTARADGNGLIVQAFCCGLRRYLHSYQGSLLCIARNLEEVTLLQLDRLTTKLREQIILTAKFCREELKASHSGIGVRGTDLLSRLYRSAVNGWCRNNYGVLVLLLHYASRPYCRFLQDWLFNGYYNDPFEEFPITLDSHLANLHDEAFWIRGFELRKSHDENEPLPFLSHLTDEALLCAKTVTLLMLCQPHKAELWENDCPTPLELTFSRESSRRIKEATQRYFDAKMKILGLEYTIKDQQTAVPLDDPQKGSPDRTHTFPTRVIPAAAKEQKSAGVMAGTASSGAFTASTKCKHSGQQSSDASSRDEEPKGSVLSTKKSEPAAEAIVAHPSETVLKKWAPLNDVGLYCEASRTYGTVRPRNCHGHSSDSQMKNILYSGLEPECSASRQKGEGAAASARKRRPREQIDAETGESVSSLECMGTAANSETLQCDDPADSSSSAKDAGDIGHARGNDDDLELCDCSESDGAFQRRDNAESPATQENEHIVTADDVEAASSDNAEKERSTPPYATDVSSADEETGQRTKARDTLFQANEIQSDQAKNGDSWLRHLNCSVKPLAPLGGLEEPDVTWKEYLISAYCTRLPNSRNGEQLLPLPPDELQELNGRGPPVPLQHAVEGSLLPPLLAQMRLVNSVAVAYFMRDLDLPGHLEALGDFFCLQDGDFAQKLCSAICETTFASRSPSDLLHRSTLCQILSEALAASLRRDSPQAARLSLDARSIPESFPSGENMVSFLILDYKVEWPLNLVITTSSLQRYNKLFHFLLQIHRAQWALTDVWFRIRPSATRRCPRAQLKSLQLIRHEMEHFIQLLQSSIGSQAVLATLRQLQDRLHSNVHNLEDLRQAHATCVTHLARRCLLVKRAAPIAKFLHRTLRSIQHFRTCVLRQPWVSAARSGELSAFGEVLAAHTSFREDTVILCQALKVWGKSASLPWCTRLSMALANSSTKQQNLSAYWNHPAVCRTALSK